MNERSEYDVAVIGGGLVGAAIGWGLARAGQRVAVLDEGDVAYRASRGNFALVWVQSKGLGMPDYAAWTKRSSDDWAGFAQLLKDEMGLDVAFQRPGGFTLCLSESELAARANSLKHLHNQPRMVQYPYEIVERDALEKLLPQIGPDVVGGSYCPLDGQCNSLRLPVRPQRGQIVVTERARPFLPYPVVTIRQTDEGTVMLGDSVEEAGWDDRVGTAVIATIARRATRMFPLLGGLNVVRSWAALRVMTADGFPIYEQSADHPGAFVATCHSGVTLAANHALAVAPMIAAGRLDADLDVFSARRFDVSKAESA